MKLPWRRRRYTLVAMRLANMTVGHPDMTVDHACARCGETLGLYPSGQGVLARYGNRVDLVCEICYGPVAPGTALAPGAAAEPFKSRRLRPR
jgi:hypothetical protein